MMRNGTSFTKRLSVESIGWTFTEKSCTSSCTIREFKSSYFSFAERPESDKLICITKLASSHQLSVKKFSKTFSDLRTQINIVSIEIALDLESLETLIERKILGRSTSCVLKILEPEFKALRSPKEQQKHYL